MNLSEIFIKRPIATSLIMLGLTVFGVIAYRALPVSDLPNVDFPTLNVNAGLPGGSTTHVTYKGSERKTHRGGQSGKAREG